jgi:exosortase/archaeosortase family protein
MRAERANLFALTIAAGFLLPLAIPGVGLDWPYFFVMVIVLFAWFIIKWDSVKGISAKSKGAEVAIGAFVIAAVYSYKAIEGSPIGILDLLVIFLGSVVIWYGFKSLKLFWVPAAYGVVLLAGYQIENIVPNYVALQNWLASVMASSLNALGIGASASQQYVTLILPNGTSELLNIEGACTGLQGILAFGMLSTMALLDLKPKISRLVPIFAIGFAGAFLINILRLLVVFLTFEFFGVYAGTQMHVYFGYLIFLGWVLAFWALAFRYLVPRPVSIVGALPVRTTLT